MFCGCGDESRISAGTRISASRTTQAQETLTYRFQ
ncbi:kinesin-like protein KIF23 isoform X5 [Prionailurus iriomotensis]